MERDRDGKQIIQKQKLKLEEVLDILKEAVTVYVKNTNFIIFTFLTSLPFFCIMVYFEISLQETVAETKEILNELPFYFRYLGYHSVYYSNVKSFSKKYLFDLIQLGSIYLVPLHVLELCSAVATIDLASKVRLKEKKMSLKQMFQKTIDISIMKGTFITSICVLFLSTCNLLAFPWITTNCYLFLKGFGYSTLFVVISLLASAKLLMMYLEWSAVWNMSIVISVLEGIYGVEALEFSSFFSRGNQKRGLLLMLVFFALGLCLRVSCVSLGCYKGGNGIIVQVGLFCVLNTLKWVACMIYFYDCKERRMEKKYDEEMGKHISSGS